MLRDSEFSRLSPNLDSNLTIPNLNPDINALSNLAALTDSAALNPLVDAVYTSTFIGGSSSDLTSIAESIQTVARIAVDVVKHDSTIAESIVNLADLALERTDYDSLMPASVVDLTNYITSGDSSMSASVLDLTNCVIDAVDQISLPGWANNLYDRVKQLLVSAYHPLSTRSTSSTANRTNRSPSQTTLSTSVVSDSAASELLPITTSNSQSPQPPQSEVVKPALVEPIATQTNPVPLLPNSSTDPSLAWARPGVGTVTAPVPPLVNFLTTQTIWNEGVAGTIPIQLTQAPATPVTVTLTGGNFLVVDADNNVQNGTQSTLTFTSTNWNLPQTIWFMPEVDGSGSDRLTGNVVNYSLAGGLTGSGFYDLGTVKNTNTPDLTRFNIELDFRNDVTGFWTDARRAIAQKAADDWAVRIANEWTGLQLNTTFSKIDNNGSYSSNTFATKRYVDDLLVFVNTINSNGSAGGYGGVEYSVGGWGSSPELKPRVGQVVIDPTVGDRYLYNAVLHELGHTLGLVGLNWEGFLQQNLATPQTATFNGIYSTAANGGIPIPLQSQDGANPVTGSYDYWHPANRVYSAMSYTYLYSVPAPTAIDFALLADSGYQVYGVNTPFPTTTASNTTTTTTSSGSTTSNSLTRPTIAGSTIA